MDRLSAELERLYAPPPGGDAATTRALGIEFARARDWAQVEALYRALQHDLDLPAPAVAVRAHAGYALWLSLAEPLGVNEARAFLDALRASYLAELPRAALALLPGDAAHGPRLPECDAASGHWSAFIDPSLGALFVDEPWLEMAPNPGQQADMLAALKSVTRAQLVAARAQLAAGAPAPAAAADEARAAGTTGTVATVDATGAPAGAPAHGARGARGSRATLALGGGFADPASFLLAVMNDPSASARQRIAAAKALLPYYPPRGD